MNLNILSGTIIIDRVSRIHILSKDKLGAVQAGSGQGICAGRKGRVCVFPEVAIAAPVPQLKGIFINDPRITAVIINRSVGGTGPADDKNAPVSKS